MGVNNDYPTTKEVLYLLGIGTLLLGSILMPGLAVAGGAIVRAKRKHDFQQDQKAWKKFNPYLLKRNIKRLHQQKIIEIIEKDGEEIVKLTQRGHAKFLRFKLEELSLKGKSWDSRWRLVIYDVNKLKKFNQNNFRRVLKQIKFYQLQKSVYLTPYRCLEEINYLREYFNLGKEVIYLEISKLENEKFYKEYFGL